MDTLSQLESVPVKYDDENPQTLIELELCAKVVKNSYAFSSSSFQDEKLYFSDKNEENEFYEYILDIIQNSINYYEVKCKKYILLHHVQQVFHKDDKVHRRALNNVINAPAKQLLSVTLKNAHLISKKHKDFTDAFCALYLDSSKSKWCTSAVKIDTTNPEWEESFEFNASLQSYDSLCVQMWYHKNRRSTAVVKFGTMRNSLSYFKKQGHKFLGYCNIPLKALVLNDEIQTFRLMKPDTMNSVGLVNLKFSLKCINEESIQRHEQLLQSLLQFEVRLLDSNFWNGKWCLAAEMLIRHHILHCELDAIWDRLLKWVVYVRIHQKHPISFNAFYNLLKELLQIDQINTNFLIETDQFWDSTRVLLHSCFSFVQKIRDLNFGGEIYDIVALQTKDIMGIFALLSSIKNTENIDMVSEETKKLCVTKMFKENGDNEKLDLRKVLELTLIQQTEKRLSNLENSNWIDKNETVEGHLVYYRKIIDQLNQDILFDVKMTDSFSTTFEFAYVEEMYVLYANHFANFCEKAITNYSNGISLYQPACKKRYTDHFFNLYFSIKKFVKLGEKYCQTKFDGLEVTKFHSWFRNSLYYLFNQCREECLQEVEQIMKLHVLQDFSTFTGTNHIELLQKKKRLMVQRLVDLSWPEIELYFKLLMDVNQYLFEYYDCYVGHLIKKFNVPKTKKKTGLEGSCIVISNIDYIIKSARDISKRYFLRVEDSSSVGISDDQKKKLETYEEECNLLIDEKIQHLQSILDLFIRNLVLESESEIKRHVMSLDRVITNDYSVALRDCKIFIFKLMSQPLGLVSENVYAKINYEFKRLTLNSLYDMIRKRKKITPLYLYNMNEAVKKTCLCLDIDESNDEELENLQREMFLHLATTGELIEKYLMERYEKQQRLTCSSFGSIQFQISHSHKSSGTIIKIIKCDQEKLKLAEQKGKIKPYVKVKFLSSKSVKDVEKYKTNCGQQFPQDIIVPGQLFCKHQWIILEVYNKCKITNSYLAESIYLTENLKIDEIITLQLSKPNCNRIYKILEQRKDDKVSNFLADIKHKSDN